MTRTAAQPFDFDEFGADMSAPEPVYTAADLEQAGCEAHDRALETLIASETRAQNDLLEKISAQLAASHREFDDAVSERRTALAAAARAITTTFCAGAAADCQIDIALGLLDKYLAATPDQTPVTLLLPHDTTDAIVTALKKAIANRNIAEFAAVETSTATKTGDCRIEWRGGAIMRDMAVINEEIKTIFASVDSDVIAACDQKARTS